MVLVSLIRRSRTSVRRKVTPWSLLVLAIALLIVTPIAVVLSSLWADSGEIWSHLATTVLPTYVLNSLALMVGVGAGVVLLGVSTAWLVSICQFPGRRVAEWALLLPLAAPAYLLAYVYTDLLEYYGPVQTGLRSLFGWQRVTDYWFPSVRSLGGAVLMFSLVLYPYVYLLARVAFREQSRCVLEASRSLGCGPWQSFWRVALPLARPAIAAGMSLALMETLSDFGTVQYFGINTFTTGIYRTWFGMGERVAASQLSSVLLLFIAVLVVLEQWSRRQGRYYRTGTDKPVVGYRLQGLQQAAAWLACGLPVALGFAIPAGVLLSMTARTTRDFVDSFWVYARNSLILAGVTALVGVLLALVMAYGRRLQPGTVMNTAVQMAALGYAFPGAVIAVGILIPVARLDNAIDAWMRQLFGISTGLLLSGTAAALVFAYLVRFLAVGFNTVDTSLTRIKPSLDDASRSLGYTPSQTLRRVHAPIMTPGLLTAAILIFVDVMKELPATLIIRPFNFDTLAVQVYRLASDERLAEAAAPALAIVLVGILPVMLLSWQMQRKTR
ncbi:MAG: iron ABC transporter permease [Cyanobacteria bacterium P01_A01_bin.135]